MKILIVSGFLGAGKTTFIAEMSRRCAGGFVVMENEMGAIGVDGGILRRDGADGMRVWELTEGCICCSMKTDFATSVLTIESALSPELLVVEPTGVGMLSRIIANIKAIEYHRISLVSPITVIDATRVRETARDFPDLFADQLRAVGTVVLSKTERMSADERDAAGSFVRATAPEAEIIARPYAEQAPEWWASLWRREASGTVAPAARDADAGLESVGFSDARVAHPGALAMVLDRAVRGAYGRVVRAKGIVRTQVEPLRFDLVEGSWSVTGAEDDEAKAVFIGRALDAEALRRDLRAVPAEHGHEHGHEHKHEHEHTH